MCFAPNPRKSKYRKTTYSLSSLKPTVKQLFPSATHKVVTLLTKNFSRRQVRIPQKPLYRFTGIGCVTNSQTAIRGQLPWHRNQQNRCLLALQYFFGLHHTVNRMKNGHTITISNQARTSRATTRTQPAEHNGTFDFHMQELFPEPCPPLSLTGKQEPE